MIDEHLGDGMDGRLRKRHFRGGGRRGTLRARPGGGGEGDAGARKRDGGDQPGDESVSNHGLDMAVGGFVRLLEPASAGPASARGPGYARLFAQGAIRHEEPRIESPRRKRWCDPPPDIF